MSKRETKYEHVWQCEDCGTIFIGVNPPDACSECGHQYHANMADTLRELGVDAEWLGRKNEVVAS